MNTSKMSDITKEKHADFLLKLSCNLMTAFYITIVIAPMGVILTQVIKGTGGTNESFFSVLQGLSDWKGVVFIVLELAVYYLAVTAQKNSYEIYDSLCSYSHKRRFKASYRLPHRSN